MNEYVVADNLPLRAAGMLLTVGYLRAAALVAIQMREASPAGVSGRHQSAAVARRFSIGVGESGAVSGQPPHAEKA